MAKGVLDVGRNSSPHLGIHLPAREQGNGFPFRVFEFQFVIIVFWFYGDRISFFRDGFPVDCYISQGNSMKITFNDFEIFFVVIARFTTQSNLPTFISYEIILHLGTLSEPQGKILFVFFVIVFRELFYFIRNRKT